MLSINVNMQSVQLKYGAQYSHELFYRVLQIHKRIILENSYKLISELFYRLFTNDSFGSYLFHHGLCLHLFLNQLGILLHENDFCATKFRLPYKVLLQEFEEWIQL